jgi:hypothetical protein
VIKKLNPDFSSDLVDLFNEETILTKAPNATKRPSYSLTINNGHFYFTENFIVFGWILE